MTSQHTCDTTCLYMIYEAGNVNPALDFCATLQRSGAAGCILYCPYFLPETEKYVNEARRLGLVYVHEATALGGDADVPQQLLAAGLKLQPFAPHALSTLAEPKPSILWRLGAKVSSRFAGEVGGWLTHYRSRLSRAHQVLHVLSASRLILPEDNVERDSACWCAAIHARGGKAIIISYASITPHEAAIAYGDHPDHAIRTWMDRLLSTFKPQWKLRHNGRALHRLPTARALAMESLGLAPARPWVVNTGAADSILVESTFMKDLFRQHGIDAARIHVTGTASLDALGALANACQTKRTQLLVDCGCDLNKKVLVCAMPPNQYPGRRSPGHANYAELAQAWKRALSVVAERFNILVAPHPSIVGTDLECLKDMGCYLHAGSVMDVLPIADLYLASVSSTIKWALACGKPVINYDCYGYDYEDFAGLSQVHTVFHEADLHELLSRFCAPSFLAEQSDLAFDKAPHFGVLDGAAKSRMVALVLA